MLLKVQIASVSIFSGSMPITNDLYRQVQNSGGAELNLDYMVEGQGQAEVKTTSGLGVSSGRPFSILISLLVRGKLPLLLIQTEVKLMLHYYAQVLTFIEM